MAWWLFKTEPDVFSIQDLQSAHEQTARWDEIRNYQARNFLRDQVKVGDQVMIYHSQCKPPAIVGAAKVVQAAYPDPSQFNPESDYFDPKSKPDNPRWYCVDIQFATIFSHPLPLNAIKNTEALAEMVLVKQGRLSIQPVRPNEAKLILKLANS